MSRHEAIILIAALDLLVILAVAWVMSIPFWIDRREREAAAARQKLVDEQRELDLAA